MADEKIVVAIFRGLAEGGASRQVVAAAAAAVCRTSTASSTPDTNEEVTARLALARPALSQLVAGRKPSGSQRACRNVAMHVAMGEGALQLPVNGTEAKKMQRGARTSMDMAREPVDTTAAEEKYGIENESKPTELCPDASFNAIVGAEAAKEAVHDDTNDEHGGAEAEEAAAKEESTHTQEDDEEEATATASTTMQVETFDIASVQGYEVSAIFEKEESNHTQEDDEEEATAAASTTTKVETFDIASVQGDEVSAIFECDWVMNDEQCEESEIGAQAMRLAKADWEAGAQSEHGAKAMHVEKGDVTKEEGGKSGAICLTALGLFAGPSTSKTIKDHDLQSQDGNLKERMASNTSEANDEKSKADAYYAFLIRHHWRDQLKRRTRLNYLAWLTFREWKEWPAHQKAEALIREVEAEPKGWNKKRRS